MNITTQTLRQQKKVATRALHPNERYILATLHAHNEGITGSNILNVIERETGQSMSYGSALNLLDKFLAEGLVSRGLIPVAEGSLRKTRLWALTEDGRRVFLTDFDTVARLSGLIAKGPPVKT